MCLYKLLQFRRVRTGRLAARNVWRTLHVNNQHNTVIFLIHVLGPMQFGIIKRDPLADLIVHMGLIVHMEGTGSTTTWTTQKQVAS